MPSQALQKSQCTSRNRFPRFNLLGRRGLFASYGVICDLPELEPELMPVFSLPVLARAALAGLMLMLAGVACAQTNDGRSVGDASTGQAIALTARPALVLAGNAEWEEGFAKLNKAFADLRAAMDRAGLKPGARPIAVFVDTDDQGFKFQAMIPLETAPAATPSFPAPIKLGETPAGKTMKFEHRSAYDDIDSTYEAITAYLDEKGIEAKPMFVEQYLNDVTSADDTSLQVDIYVFVK